MDGGRDVFAIVEKDEAGMFVGEVPHLCACYAQGSTLDGMLVNIREVIALCLEENPQAIDDVPEFIGVQKVVV